MIYDRVENGSHYLGISPNLDKALHYMMDTDLAALEDGRYAIDGEDVYVTVSEAVTVPGKERYEFHKEFYDIQIDLTGTEDIWFATEHLEITTPYQEEKDMCFGTCQGEVVCHMAPGKFVVCEPGEWHMPLTATGEKEEKVRKAVFKIRKDD